MREQKKAEEMDRTVADLAALVQDMQAQQKKQTADILTALEANTAALKDYAIWKPTIDSKLDELHTGVTDLQRQIHLLQENKVNKDAAHRVFDVEHLDLTKPAVAHLTASSSEAASGPLSHGESSHHRGSGFGVGSTLLPPPVADEDIRAAVMMHQPVNIDTASSLAILQEEISRSSLKKDNPRHAVGAPSKYSNRSSWPSVPSSVKQLDAVKSRSPNSDTKHSEPVKTVSPEDKIAAVRAFRKAKGLCFRCAVKWNPGHKCASTVPLNVVDELWQILEDSDSQVITENADSDSGDDLMALSLAAVHGADASRTIKFQGSIKRFPAFILIDSGSSGNFVSEQFASLLPNWNLLSQPVEVRVANGSVILCTHEISHCKVVINGHAFDITLKILPLQCYDVILGIDWLEQYSPMQVHWKDKWLLFQLHGQPVKLQGLLPNLTQCPLVTNKELHQLDNQAELWCIVQLYSVQEQSTVSHCPKELHQLVDKYSGLFSAPKGLPPSRPFDHTIQLIPGAQPFRLKPYRYNPAQKDEIEKQVAELLSNGMIQASASPFASPVLLAKKKGGEWRLCVDYRRLNALTVKDKFPLPVIDELIDELSGAQWFTSLDMKSGFHQIRMASTDMYKTAFQTHFGHFEYKVMPYGLTGAPATFQRVMNVMLAPLLRVCVIVFIDDILVYSKTWSDHLQHQQLPYLGHIISAQGVATDPHKISIVQHWPVPTSIKELRSFLGMAGYYRKFVKHFGVIAKPLTDLLKKNIPFVWTDAHDFAFHSLKEALVTAPVLALPDFSKPFTIETDASAKGVGAVLHQQGHPIAFVSKALGVRNQGLSIYEKECLAILMAIDHWRSYLQQGEFLILTDQKSLTHLDDQKLSTPWQQKAFTKLLGLQYKICYKKGYDNKVADALSRVVAPSHQEVLAVSLLLAALSVSSPMGHFTLKNGLIRYKSRIWLAHNPAIQQHILEALHASPTGGHSGVHATYMRIKNLFAWPGLKRMVHTFVTHCAVCQQAKSEWVKYPGLLQPLPVPDYAWQVVSMDFIEGLPLSKGFNCILVVVDKFSKYAHFIPLSHPFTAMKIAMVYMDNIFKLHGLPQAIISDRDRIFTSTLWQELFRLSGTALRMSSAYHPQNDGQTERVNQCLETYLRCFVHGCPTKWKDWLSLAEFWYNTSYHSSLNKTPFEVLYGTQPHHLGIDRVESCAVDDLQEWLKNRKLMTQSLQLHLHRAQQRQKLQADKNRTERTFSVGDSVYVKLQPYIQQSVMPRASYKLSFRYFGPFTIIDKIGAVAYKLQLPPSSAIHPVFHVSQLKQAVGTNCQVSSVLPPKHSQFQIPLRVLQRRSVSRGDRNVSQVLIHWSTWPVSLATWEDEAVLRQQFPAAPAWGQAGTHGGGNVMTEKEEPLKKSEEKADQEKRSVVAVAGNHKKNGRVIKLNQKYYGPSWKPK
ncbi:hypothetical protein U9M48_034038 [Paspalum notatum var. saurae]|uniref:Uncharacterized protein n=1 Tax=Paspalum notatum var. saurae TaxID=547442 RepID=A0AAQ3U9Z5_PASNO